MICYIFRKAAQFVMRYGMPIVDKMSRKTHIIRGVDSSREVGQYCIEKAHEKPLIITDQQIITLGLLESTLDSLNHQSIPYEIFDKVSPDPTHAIIFDACKEGISFGADCIIAVGGGSVMDCAKVASIGIRNPNLPKGFLTRMHLGPWPKTIPLITIPTTAGTGAEVTLGAVITDEKHQRKHFAGGRKVFHNLPKVLEDPQDMDSRQELCEAANIGGHSINLCSAGYAHSFAHVLGATYHISHGTTIAMTLPWIIDYNREASEK